MPIRLMLLAVMLAGTLGPAQTARGEALGDPARGERLWRLCSGCHMVGPDARNRVGPHLNDLFGRRAASVPGYRYSADMARAGPTG
ncbi:MAG: hypothetical protein KatS3mg118_1691 [Paracoccaceae bacterium]|nr:MAG: hypothetical protein KatS3mg118_1691 [Paracoccaceae bacterium]